MVLVLIQIMAKASFNIILDAHLTVYCSNPFKKQSNTQFFRENTSLLILLYIIN